MNFFKAALFGDDYESMARLKVETAAGPETETAVEDEEGERGEAKQEKEHEEDEEEEKSAGLGLGLWGLGGLVKTLQSRSEEVMQTYRRDLQDFRAGLQSEIRQVASRAVHDLPGHLEIGTSVAQESLESVGQAIDDLGSTVWQGTAGLLARARLDDSDGNGDVAGAALMSGSGTGAGGRKYSRLEAQIRAMQMDSSSYLNEPDERPEFEAWLAGFSLRGFHDEIETLCRENRVVDEIRLKLVPRTLDEDTFWSRYFYRLHKIRQADEARASLVKRAIRSQDADEEELTWEFDDDDDNTENVLTKQGDVAKPQIQSKPQSQPSESFQMKTPTADFDSRLSEASTAGVKSDEVLESGNGVTTVAAQVVDSFKDLPVDVKIAGDASSVEKIGVKLEAEPEVEKKLDEEGSGHAHGQGSGMLEAKVDPAESSKSSDFSVVSSKPSSAHEDDDLGWDEIEDLSIMGDRKLSLATSPRRADIRKRLSAEAEDEDLSWDVED